VVLSFASLLPVAVASLALRGRSHLEIESSRGKAYWWISLWILDILVAVLVDMLRHTEKSTEPCLVLAGARLPKGIAFLAKDSDDFVKGCW